MFSLRSGSLYFSILSILSLTFTPCHALFLQPLATNESEEIERLYWFSENRNFAFEGVARV